jgi:hypothetical protein
MERQLRAGGGIMGLEEPRQGYFLGKIVKKAKRAVKKVVKSPVGKAALLAGGAYLAGGFMPGGGGLTGGLANFRNFGGGVASLFDKGRFLSPLVRNKAGEFSLGRAALTGLGATALAAPFFMGGEEEEPVEEIDITQTPESIANIVNQARNRDSSLRFLPKPKFVDNFYLADGGRAGYDNGGGVMQMASNMENDAILQNLYEKFLDMGMSPSEAEKAARQEFDRMSQKTDMPRTEAAEGGLMDLGGLEKDYREGGFVPLGAEERADDVPARLSKNEFVFTAEAVRNAGGGDIDKGAEVMQNMMDNLEAGGTISEESQGEENPAQEMFDQSQQLESRIA